MRLKLSQPNSSHNRQETTLVHPITQKSAVQAETIPPPPPAPSRCEASSAAAVPSASTLNNHEPRKAGGRRRGGSWVKTPGARRPEVAPVTYQGWLYKQGGDGLHLWKKRWFVLSEYCLYYYKGPNEDNVLGSLPLPSFKISPVDSDDRVYRRHAFKAEHQNTRTYYFAAETKEQMAHWMNALSLASILQKDTSNEEKLSSGSSARRSERPSVSSLASTASPSADESDSGFHGYRSRRYRSPDERSIDEASESSRLQGDRLNTSCESSVILRPGERQPLYANAPPKPKRLNTSRDYSTSPERSPERDERTPCSYTDHAERGSGRSCSTSSEARGVHYHPPTAERRTPDTYGVAAGGGRGDYEDVYGDSNESNSMLHTPVRRPDQRDSFASSKSGGTRLSEEFQLSDPLRSKFARQEDTVHRNPQHRYCPTGPPRPHSADFLEYDRRHGRSEMWSSRRGSGGELRGHNETRPKSSVGQAESDHWSEENYAQKMRQSSLYHSHVHSRSAMRYSPAGPAENVASDHNHMHSILDNGSQRVPPAGAATPDLYTPHKLTPTPDNITDSLRRGVGQESSEIPRPDVTVDPKTELKPYPRLDPRQAPPQQEARFNHRLDPSLDHRVYTHEGAASKLDVSPNSTLNSVSTPPNSYPSSVSPSGSLNNNFIRSASARLPRQHLQEDLINTSLPDDASDGDTRKMQQREESMKRLLEWKQRMLHSPLTRKSNARPDGTTTPQLRTNDEAYRQQVLNELASQEARTKVLQNYPHSQHNPVSKDTNSRPLSASHIGPSHGYQSSIGISPRQTPVQNNWIPANHRGSPSPGQCSGTSPGGLYLSPGIPSERPAPQGGSCPTGSDSGGSKKKETRRESSRTRHVSGDARRSTSASRYNSYSSDEEDLLEEREARKRTRRNSRRSSADLSRESRKLVMSADDCGSFVTDDRLQGSPANFVENSFISEDTLPSESKSSPDYVNIDIVSESQEVRTSSMVNSSLSCVENRLSERTVSQRAEPVFIENHEGYDEVKKFDQLSQSVPQHLSVSRTCEQSYVYSDQIYAARDPYYVSDVQLPAVNDKYEEDRNDILSHAGIRREYISSYGAESSIQRKYKTNNDIYENNEFNREKIFNDSKNFIQNAALVNEESLDNSVGYASFDSHVTHKSDNATMHASQKSSSQDDATSTGKHSDSGYDTLRAEMSMHRDERRNGRPSGLWAPDTMDSSPECSSVMRRRGFDHSGRRPETWSPEKFERSWSTIDSDLKSKVDESKVVKEYSYEYITPEKRSDPTPQDNFDSSNHNDKKSVPNLAFLESPKMVQETQHQAQNLVQDRIKKFTSTSLESKETFNNHYDVDNHMNTNRYGELNMNNVICINSEVNHFREPLKEPLKPLSPQIRSSEALVSPLKAEFATSESTIVTAQEAQVKNVSDYKRREEIFGSQQLEGSPLSNARLNSGSESSSMEYRELRSPQDIMDSRLSRTNIRKFLFDDDTRSDEPKIEQQTNSIHVKPPLMKKPVQTRSVKALLKNFEEKSIEHMEKVNMFQDSSRKKFHSDSEMLSNESSSDEGHGEDIFCTPEKNVISPTSSVLVELRKSADYKRDDLPPPLVPPPRPPKKPTLGGEIDGAVTPTPSGFLRLSYTESIQESLKVQEDSESFADEPSWMNTTLNSEQSKLSNPIPMNGDAAVIDLDKPPEEEAPPPPLMYLSNGEVQNQVMGHDSQSEENYLPMSPPKKPSQGSNILAPASSSSSLSSKHLPTPEPVYPDPFAKTEYEEHTYIEMSGDISSSGASILTAGGHPRFDMGISVLNEPVFPPESPRYYEISDKDECQHYEYIYKNQPHYEAIYMEVPNAEKCSLVESEKPEIPSKPEELKAQINLDKNSAAESGLNSSLNKLDLKSQSNASSDADDEASKDLESLDPPRNPRFSLSDTFRPASYYLSGAEPSSDPDAQDSSDSDLVPPPPIPMSPPPLDDLDTGGPKAKNFDFDNLETPDPPLHLRNALSSSRSLRVSQNNLHDDINTSRSSLRKEKRIFETSDSQSSFHADKLKRRPVFEETLENLHDDDDNFILRSEDRYPVSAAYPEDTSLPATEKFQRDRRKPFPHCAEDVLLPGDKHELSARPKAALDPNSSQGNLDTTYLSHNIENPYVNEGFQQSLSHLGNPYQSAHDGREYCNIPPNAKMFSQSERERTSSTGSRPKSPDPYAERNELSAYQNIPVPRAMSTNSPLTTANNIEPTGSPMIDALRGIHSPVHLHLQPNHQRTSSEASSRSVVSPTASVVSGGVGVAPMHLRATSNASVGSETSPRSAPYYYSDVIRDDTAAIADCIVGTPRSRSYQLNNQRDLEANKRQDIGRKVNQISSASDFEQRRERLAHELRTSVEFLEGKTVSIPDERNVYDSDTLRKMKRRAYTPDPELDAKNMFPHGLSIKMDSPPLGPVVGHRRTRSLEGFLDESPRPFLGESTSVQSPHEVNMTRGEGSSEGSKWANTSTFPSVHPTQISVMGGVGASSSLTSNTTHTVATPNRGAFSQLTSQRASVSSLQSSGSLPQRTTSPYATSPLPVSPVPPYQVGSRDSLVSKESSASRFSGYDPRVSQELRSPTNHETLHEEQDWEDDSQWREQLRRASLRHTRSLETLDDGRPRRGSDGSSREGRPLAKLSVPSNISQAPVDTNQQRLQQLHWDEYTVDYREGRLGSSQYRNNGALLSETLERTRRGLTCLEGYEWDEAEEKFKKPGHPGRPQQPLPQVPANSTQHQTFLVDGLPTSPGMEGEEQRQCQVSPAPPPAHVPPSPPPQLQTFLAGGGEGSDVFSGVGGRPPGDFQGREEPLAASPHVYPLQDAASPQPAPDVIPPHDVKLGESLPRKLDTNPGSMAGSQPSSHTHIHPHTHPQSYQQHHPLAHSQNYQHLPHPHSQNQYHHYKSDDLHKYHNYRDQQQPAYHQSNGPYANTYNGGHGYSHGYPDNHMTYSHGGNYKHAQSHRPHTYQENYHHHHQQKAHPATVISDYNNTLSSQQSSSGRGTGSGTGTGTGTGTYRSGHYDFQDYHNYKNHQQDFKHHLPHSQQDYKDYRHADYGTYEKHLRHNDQRLNGRSHGDVNQFSDSEVTIAKQQQPSLPVSPLGQDTVDVRGLQRLSAGELLGKTHEELVLLLIQLRRHHSALQSARHHSRVERDSQAHLAQLDGEHREDHLRRLASLNHHMLDLDKQYEMGKPLINLVDNMVKLGSLYRGGESRVSAQQDPGHSRYYPKNGIDSLQFSRRIQERRIVAEDLQLQEQELASADQSDLEGKVMQLYKLDKNLHQESLTIQSLQREKEMLERTLVNLQSKSHGANEGPVELERRKNQRRHLEHELSKLRAHLAVSARKLEETAAENSRLEHEMMMLRQKIQMTMARNSQREAIGTSETRHIQSEMVRVQTLLEDLQRRRIELSHQIQKLTSTNPGLEIRPSPTGVAGAAPVPARRRTHSTWLETDLDAMTTRDWGMEPPEVNRRGNPPVYVNASGYIDEMLLNGDHNTKEFMTLDRDAADNKPDGEEQQQPTSHMDINDADDRMKRYYGILPKEKPLEIKTVRIVKRESTERRKDRTTGGKRVTIGNSSLTHLLEDDVESDGLSDTENEPPMPSFAERSASLPRNYGRNGPGEKVSMMSAMMRTNVGNSGTMTRPSNLALRKSTNWKSKSENPKDRPLSAHEQLFGFSRETESTPPASPSKSDPPSPVFKSAAAKEIIKEMASEAEKHRRTVPKEKRRHFTISSSRPLTLETRDTGAEEGARSRDDCDMVRALRPRNHPDVVKSTLSTRDLRFNESTIDNILGAPNKIYIPERYMPDEDDEKEPTAEERAQREQKAQSIRKMLSETRTTVTADEASEETSSSGEGAASSSTRKAKVAAERKEREHLLALNQILARQVMEKSRVVAAHTTVEPHL